MKEIKNSLSDNDIVLYNMFMNYDQLVSKQFILTGIERRDCGSIYKMHFTRKFSSEKIKIVIDLINLNEKYGVRETHLLDDDIKYECFINCSKKLYNIKFTSNDLENVFRFINTFNYLIYTQVL